MKSTLKSKVRYMLFLVLFTIIALEVILRIYNPFPPKFIGDLFEMPANTRYVFNNANNNGDNPRLDNIVIHQRNSLGFRGPEPPDSINKYLTIIAVGGSTTACTYLGEGHTWCDQLQQRLQKTYPAIWINNAGVDGHSTNGHLSFFYHYMPRLAFKPRIMLFLVGANDVDLSHYDSVLFQPPHTFKRWLQRNSETVGLLYYLKWSIKPHSPFTVNKVWNFTHFQEIHLDAAYIDSALQKQGYLVDAYERRLDRLIDLCREQNIQPILITQPTVFGDGTPEGGNPRLDFHVFHEKENGQLFWLKLQRYNARTKAVATAKNVYCIDLAAELPRDTAYYYDIVHYTNAGAAKIADILAPKLDSLLKTGYPAYYRQ